MQYGNLLSPTSEGKLAYESNKTVGDNPYSPGTKPYHEWLLGFNRATYDGEDDYDGSLPYCTDYLNDLP